MWRVVNAVSLFVPEYSNSPGGVEAFVAYSECNKRNRLTAKRHSGGWGSVGIVWHFSGPPSFLNAELNDTAQKILGTEAVHTRANKFKTVW